MCQLVCGFFCNDLERPALWNHVHDELGRGITKVKMSSDILTRRNVLWTNWKNPQFNFSDQSLRIDSIL